MQSKDQTGAERQKRFRNAHATITVTQGTKARLLELSQAQGVTVTALIDQLLSGPAVTVTAKDTVTVTEPKPRKTRISRDEAKAREDEARSYLSAADNDYAEAVRLLAKADGWESQQMQKCTTAQGLQHQKIYDKLRTLERYQK